jgi:hypothetical protein
LIFVDYKVNSQDDEVFNHIAATADSYELESRISSDIFTKNSRTTGELQSADNLAIETMIPLKKIYLS